MFWHPPRDTVEVGVTVIAWQFTISAMRERNTYAEFMMLTVTVLSSEEVDGEDYLVVIELICGSLLRFDLI